MIAVLRHPTYAKLFSAQVIALLGTGLLTVALGLLAFGLGGTTAALLAWRGAPGGDRDGVRMGAPRSPL